MKRRLIAVTLVTATALLGAPAMASASTGHAHISHITKTMPAGPPFCC